MASATAQPASAPPPERVHVGKPEDLFPTPFVGQRVALRSPSRGPEVRMFTVTKVFEVGGDVVAELERVGPSGPSTERFDVVWRVHEDSGCVGIRSHLPPDVAAEIGDNREDDVEAMPWHPLPPPSADIPSAVTAKQTRAFIDGVTAFLQKPPIAGHEGIELCDDAGSGSGVRMHVIKRTFHFQSCETIVVAQL